MDWGVRYMKQDFSKVLWTDKCRATLNRPDGWARGWVLNGRSSRNRVRRQQDGEGIMFWDWLLGNTIVDPFRVEQGVKLNSQNYFSFLTRNFMPWFQQLSDQDKETLILMQDYAPSHASKYSRAWFSDNVIGGSKLMTWPPNSPDLNPNEMLRSLIKFEGVWKWQAVFERRRPVGSCSQGLLRNSRRTLE